MAASGINEHHEALRKQNFINRQNYLKKQFLEKLRNNPEEIRAFHLENNASRNGNETARGERDSYELENLHRKYSSAKTMEEKRNIQKHIDYLTYTAKIKGRFSTTNYLQQW